MGCTYKNFPIILTNHTENRYNTGMLSNHIQEQIMALLPPKRKQSASGWITGMNCPVCHLEGQPRPDTRGRGQIIFNRGGVAIFCHNCHFKTGWVPGGIFGRKISRYLEALGAEHEQVQKMQLEAMQFEAVEYEDQPLTVSQVVKKKKMPSGAKSFHEWAQEPDPPEKFIQALEYVNQRNPRLLDIVDFHWTPETIGRKDGRILIPLKYQGEITGFSARWFDGDLDGRPKYINDIPSGMMYNADLLDDPFRKYVVLVEGGLDAAAIDGIGIMKNRITEQQFKWIQASGKTPIVLADRDKAGDAMIDQAIKFNWMVSFPEWDEDLKDAEEAIRRYGRLFTVDRILSSAVSGELMIGVKRKQYAKI